MTQLTPFRSRLADQLSGGMKQKLALACTLVHEPDIILLDEPTTGVDPVSRREFWKLLSQFLANGITIVMSTPYLDEAERCSRVAMLDQGRLLALDEPDRLRASLPGTLLEVVVARAARAHWTRCAHAHVSPTRRCSATAFTSGRTPRTRRRRSGLRRAGARRRASRHKRPPLSPSLEDVFIDFMKLTARRAPL